MDFTHMLRALRARLGLAAIVFMTTVMTTIIVTAVMPRTYKAAAALLIEPRDMQSLGNGPQEVNFHTPQERQSYLQTQADILGSRNVARKVVEQLELVDAAAREAFVDDTGGKGNVEDWLADQLLKRFKVETTQSNVLQAVYSAPDADLAARVANGFAAAYLEMLLEIRTNPARNTAAWLDEQTARLRGELDAAQARLTEFLRRQKFTGTDERYDPQAARLSALTDQSLRAREQAAQGTAREQAARQHLAQGGSLEGLPEVADNALIQRLRADLHAGEAKLQELATQYGPNHPAYQRQESQNQALGERLEAETAKVLAGIEHAARQGRQREAAAASIVASERDKQLAQRATQDEASVLRRHVESATRAYDLALQRAAVARVESRAQAANVVLMSPAVPPLLPASPRAWLNLVVAIVVGAMLALAVALLMELRDRRVRSPADLVAAVDLPLIGAIGAWNPGRPAAAIEGRAERRALTGPI